MQPHQMSFGQSCKLRRIYAGLRQQDVASGIGISATRYSAIERGELEATDLEKTLIHRVLPELPLDVSVTR
ncbi:MAG: helix-turn-helix transcriptional regulator [Terriglobales bacterium]